MIPTFLHLTRENEVHSLEMCVSNYSFIEIEFLLHSWNISFTLT